MVRIIKSLLLLLLAIGANSMLFASKPPDNSDRSWTFDYIPIIDGTGDHAHVTYTTTNSDGPSVAPDPTAPFSTDTSFTPSQESWAPERLNEDYTVANTRPEHSDQSATVPTATDVKTIKEAGSNNKGSGSVNSGLSGTSTGSANPASSSSPQVAQSTWDAPFAEFQTKEKIAHIQHLIDSNSPELRNSKVQSILTVLENSGKVVIPHKIATPSDVKTHSEPMPTPIPRIPQPSPAPAPMAPPSLGQRIDNVSYGQIINGARTATGVASLLSRFLPARITKIWTDYAYLPDPRSPEYQRAEKESYDANTIHVMTKEELEACLPHEFREKRDDLGQAQARLELLRNQIASDQLERQRYMLEHQKYMQQFEPPKQSYGKQLAAQFIDIILETAAKEVTRWAMNEVKQYVILKAHQHALKKDAASRKKNFETIFRETKQAVEKQVYVYTQRAKACSHPNVIRLLEVNTNELARYKAEYMSLTGKAELDSVDTITIQNMTEAIARINSLPLSQQGDEYWKEHRKRELEIAYSITKEAIENLTKLKDDFETTLKEKTTQFNASLEKASFEETDNRLKALNFDIDQLERERDCYTQNVSAFQARLNQVNDKLAAFGGSYTRQGLAAFKGYVNSDESYNSLMVIRNRYQENLDYYARKCDAIVNVIIVAQAQRDCILKRQQVSSSSATAKLTTAVYSSLQPNGAQLLAQFKIDAESFATNHDDPLLRNILDQTGGIVNRTSNLYQHLQDRQIYDLVESTLDSCKLAHELAKQGASKEAQIVVHFASALSTSAQVQDAAYRIDQWTKAHPELSLEALEKEMLKEQKRAWDSLIEGVRRTGRGESVQIAIEKIQTFKNDPLGKNVLEIADLAMTIISFRSQIKLSPQTKIMFVNTLQSFKAIGNNLIRVIKGIDRQPHPQPALAAGAIQVPLPTIASQMASNRTGSSQRAQKQTDVKSARENKPQSSSAATGQASANPHGIYKEGDHSLSVRGLKDPAPKNGQDALDKSILYKVKGNNNNERRLSYENDKFVVIDQTLERPDGIKEFHGHVRSWEKLEEEMRTFLTSHKLTDNKGKLLDKWKKQ